MTTQTAVGLSTRPSAGPEPGDGGMAIGVVALAIVAGCWLSVHGFNDERPAGVRRSLRILRIARAARAVMKEALDAVRERI